MKLKKLKLKKLKYIEQYSCIDVLDKGYIDVLAIINQKYCIIIEDKKNTKQHSEQLERYKKIAKEDFKGEGIKIYKGIYFKMIEESSTNEQEIKKAGYYHFKRDNMLNVLQNYFNKVNEEKQNNILADYWSYLNKLEQKYLSFKELTFEKWSWDEWAGFFSKLQEKIEILIGKKLIILTGDF